MSAFWDSPYNSPVGWFIYISFAALLLVWFHDEVTFHVDAYKTWSTRWWFRQVWIVLRTILQVLTVVGVILIVYGLITSDSQSKRS
jgi:hypothetical protein